MPSIAGFTGQLVVPELVNIATFRFPCDLFQHRTGKNFRAENSGDFFFFNLLDEPYHLTRAGIGKIGGLDGADNLETIAPREVRPRVMIGKQPPVVLWDRL